MPPVCRAVPEAFVRERTVPRHRNQLPPHPSLLPVQTTASHPPRIPYRAGGTGWKFDQISSGELDNAAGRRVDRCCKPENFFHHAAAIGIIQLCCQVPTLYAFFKAHLRFVMSEILDLVRVADIILSRNRVEPQQTAFVVVASADIPFTRSAKVGVSQRVVDLVSRTAAYAAFRIRTRCDRSNWIHAASVVKSRLIPSA